MPHISGAESTDVSVQRLVYRALGEHPQHAFKTSKQVTIKQER
ncbi:hypothetical protein QWZ16_17715 [Vibrio ostreicida]|uniref:Uncharacterized protein n=1 Tax=Vibrio ostreicida TaxID=526588 RepID=A0ABT8BZE0_9VIBR|nr:hypothetical protein [Vibrio ostreicida]MDN3611440.1 hypothetical protein [Vibrio ostreicida]